MTEPQFDFGKGVVTNESQQLSDIATTLKEIQKPTPQVEAQTPAPVITDKKEDGEKKPEGEKVELQVKSEIDKPEVIVEKAAKGKGKKQEADKKPEVVIAKDKQGKEVPIKQFSQEQIDRLDNSIAEDEPAEKIKDKSEVVLADAEKAEKQPKSKATELPKDIQERLERLAILESIVETPAYALAEKLTKEGKTNVKDIIKDFDLNDYDSLSNKDVYKISLEQQGITGDELIEALDEFESLPAYKQKIETNPIRSKLKDAANEKNNIFSSQTTKEQIREFTKIQKQAASDGMNRLNELVEKTVTEGYFGFPVSKEDLEVVRNEVLNNTVIAADGKSYDVDATFTRAINHPSIVRKAIKYAREVGRFEGYEDFIKERIRVDKNDFVQGQQGGKSEYVFSADVVKNNA